MNRWLIALVALLVVVPVAISQTPPDRSDRPDRPDPPNRPEVSEQQRAAALAMRSQCFREQAAACRAGGGIPGRPTTVQNADGTSTVSRSCCPRCTFATPPCAAPCTQQTAVVNPVTGDVTCGT